MKKIDNDNTFGMYVNELDSCKPLPKQEILALAVKAKNGDKIAREKIARANLRYAFKLASEYTKYGVSIEELVASANVGLSIALNKFNPEFGANFTTYAKFWMKDEINKTLNKSHDIVLPRNNAKELSKQYNTFASSIDDENFVESSVDDSYKFDLEQNTAKKMLSDNIKLALKCIDCEDAFIIRKHFGLDCEPMSLQAIGDIFGLSKERIRQREAAALRQIRNGEGAKYLEGYTA